MTEGPEQSSWSLMILTAPVIQRDAVGDCTGKELAVSPGPDVIGGWSIDVWRLVDEPVISGLQPLKGPEPELHETARPSNTLARVSEMRFYWTVLSFQSCNPPSRTTNAQWRCKAVLAEAGGRTQHSQDSFGEPDRRPGPEAKPLPPAKRPSFLSHSMGMFLTIRKFCPCNQTSGAYVSCTTGLRVRVLQILSCG